MLVTYEEGTATRRQPAEGVAFPGRVSTRDLRAGRALVVIVVDERLLVNAHKPWLPSARRLDETLCAISLLRAGARVGRPDQEAVSAGIGVHAEAILGRCRSAHFTEGVDARGP